MSKGADVHDGPGETTRPLHVLVAGSTGHLGREVVAHLLTEPGSYRVTRLVRPRGASDTPVASDVRTGDVTRPATLRGVCDGIDVVVSCVGASVSLSPTPGQGSYDDVDAAGNLNLLSEAERAGVSKVVYVSAALAPGILDTAYVRAHERVVAALRQRGMPHAVVRPTGLFCALLQFLDMARSGFALTVGEGDARTNPVHEADAARVVVEAVRGDREEYAVGGPEVMTRSAIVSAAFGSVGRPRRGVAVPPGVMRFGSKLVRPFDRRLHDFLEFALAVSSCDVIAPQVGTRRLADYFAERAGLTPRGRDAAPRPPAPPPHRPTAPR